MSFEFAMSKGAHIPSQKQIKRRRRHQIDLLSRISNGLTDIFELASRSEHPLLLMYVELALVEACESLCIVLLPLVKTKFLTKSIESPDD